jgi:type III restriction enzyme
MVIGDGASGGYEVIPSGGIYAAVDSGIAAQSGSGADAGAGGDVAADFLGDYSSAVGSALGQKTPASVEDMMQQAATQTREYEREAEESERLGYLGGLEGAMKNQRRMNAAWREEAGALLVPQFCYENKPFTLYKETLYSEEYALTDKKKLSLGFSLNNADSNVNFSLGGGAFYAVDATDGGVGYRKMKPSETEHLRAHMERMKDDEKREYCVKLIANQLNRGTIGDLIGVGDFRAYVGRVMENLSNDDLAAIETGYQFYASRIRLKIETLLTDYRETEFGKQLDSNVILCKPLYALPEIITPLDTLDGLEKALYESEAGVNATERKVIEEIAALPNVKWWHRIAESKPYSFCINGFITQYPDFMVMTEKGALVIVEVKGDDRDNSDSERKLRLGRRWADKAGEGFRYFMVFDKLNWRKEGAYDLSEFMGIMEKL